MQMCFLNRCSLLLFAYVGRMQNYLNFVQRKINRNDWEMMGRGEEGGGGRVGSTQMVESS